tara:strand:- start:1855 stop:2895 length:1041 start_codon:yes stop_codon:yes gene_type:complete
MAVSINNIHVGWVQGTQGYVKHKTVEDANVYAAKNPGTQFIFVDGDRKVHFITIDEVNKLTVRDLLRKEPCVTRQLPCPPPTLTFFGGRGIGALANPVIDSQGRIIAVDMVRGGVGYKSAPQIKVFDPCNSGKGVSFNVDMKDGQVAGVTVLDSGFGYIPTPIDAPSAKEVVPLADDTAVGTAPAVSTAPGGSIYPALIQLSDVTIQNSGFNYNPEKDTELTIEPNNGTVLRPVFGPFGRVKGVKVEKGGNFTDLPRISLPSDTGLNARFTPVFNIIRDPLVPQEAPLEDIVQVFDTVGLDINGYVDGKAYYGNVYFDGGVKYAGTGGSLVRVYDTIQDSVTGSTN